MRVIEVDGTPIKVRANPLALLYYKQEFKRDLLSDLTKLQEIAEDPSKIDALLLLQILWAMAKAGSGNMLSFPGYVDWLDSIDSFPLGDEAMLDAIVEEALDGFFRGRSAGRST